MKLTKRQRRYLSRETRKLLPSPMPEIYRPARIIATHGYWEPIDEGGGEYVYRSNGRDREKESKNDAR